MAIAETTTACLAPSRRDRGRWSCAERRLSLHRSTLRRGNLVGHERECERQPEMSIVQRVSENTRHDVSEKKRARDPTGSAELPQRSPEQLESRQTHRTPL